MSEADRITIEELRKHLSVMESWQAKYHEAAELWDALEVQDDQHVVGAVLVAKLKDFDSGVVSISMANTDDVDWVDQIGILRSGTLICEGAEIRKDDD